MEAIDRVFWEPSGYFFPAACAYSTTAPQRHSTTMVKIVVDRSQSLWFTADLASLIRSDPFAFTNDFLRIQSIIAFSNDHQYSNMQSPRQPKKTRLMWLEERKS